MITTPDLAQQSLQDFVQVVDHELLESYKAIIEIVNRSPSLNPNTAEEKVRDFFLYYFFRIHLFSIILAKTKNILSSAFEQHIYTHIPSPPFLLYCSLIWESSKKVDH